MLNNKAENIQTNAKKALVMLFTPCHHHAIKPCSVKKNQDSILRPIFCDQVFSQLPENLEFSSRVFISVCSTLITRINRKVKNT